MRRADERQRRGRGRRRAWGDADVGALLHEAVAILAQLDDVRVVVMALYKGMDSGRGGGG